MAARPIDTRAHIRKSNFGPVDDTLLEAEMSRGQSSLFSDAGVNLRAKVIGMYVLLIGANIAAWRWALSAFRDYPILLGTAMLAYTFGLRHAFDADHIAASTT
jgi:high-affinity nickel permease